ncbi:MAG: hypothetical protein PUB12_06760 [[Clostridium] aminophilum]|uniref:hypothetical protein n=1 Tax=[Clostridium] aminophilum TaxID=1526 RepID=UPI0026F08365|nr:hypothetical protein [[Clostridium] aminophilum]MDD6196571.1 hypothetical protein [[Clostridium] aminophilum]
MKMTIEEAIKQYQRREQHAAERAKRYMDDHETKSAEVFMDFASEYSQIVEWLEDLKRRRAGDTKKTTSLEMIDDAINKVEEAAENLTQIAEWLKEI